MRIHVICAFRNRPDFLEPCLKSIVAQDDTDFEVHVGDDNSVEGVEEIDVVLDQYHRYPNWNIYRRVLRLGVVGNQITMIHATEMAPEDILVFLDGDDCFADAHVLSRLREVYEGTQIDLTYGNYEPDPPNDACPPVKWIPPVVCQTQGQYREFVKREGTCWNHLRTMRRRVFDAIPTDYFSINGQWLDGGADFALMTPGLELAGGRHFMFTETMVIYTSDRPDAEWRVLGAGIAQGRRYTNSRPALPPLPPLEIS